NGALRNPFTSSMVVLSTNGAMIVRVDDESNENAHDFTADEQRDPPVVATERFRSPSASQPYLPGRPGQGDRSVETAGVGSYRFVRAAGAGSPDRTNERQCRPDRRVVRIESRRRSRTRHRPRCPTFD